MRHVPVPGRVVGAALNGGRRRASRASNAAEEEIGPEALHTVGSHIRQLLLDDLPDTAQLDARLVVLEDERAGRRRPGRREVWADIGRLRPAVLHGSTGQNDQKDADLAHVPPLPFRVVAAAGRTSI